MSATLRGRTVLLLLAFTASTALTASSAHGQTPAQSDSAAKAAASARELPLIPTRTLSFTTDEGSWISLDVAPDGERIAFELLGDLYTLPIGGGTAERITDGQAYDMQPRFSPDGTQLVFVSDRDGSENIWIADADGTNARALTRGERDSYISPVWTPDGQYIIATKGSQLWLYHTEGGSGFQITGQPAGAAGGGGSQAYLGAAFGSDARRARHTPDTRTRGHPHDA